VDYYLRSGKLESIGRAAYRRPGPPLKWEHFVYSLQEMGYELHIGARTALDIQGFAHYLEPNGIRRITLYSNSKLPQWLKEIEYVDFVRSAMPCFNELDENFFTAKSFGHWDWKLHVASVELALFEMVCEVKSEADFAVIDKYFESATTLRPKLINALLAECNQIKTKRLFLWFADRHNHQWNSEIDRSTIELGSGKRMIVSGGILDKKYQITVPREMASVARDFF
jgi:hypothetical protein